MIDEKTKNLIMIELKQQLRIAKSKTSPEHYFKECYKIMLDGEYYIILANGDKEIGMMYSATTGELVGVQPMDYVRENGELL